MPTILLDSILEPTQAGKILARSRKLVPPVEKTPIFPYPSESFV
jgi:hypothetical protein